MATKKMQWRCHAPNLISDIIAHIDPDGLKVVRTPIMLFREMLVELAEVASELDNPKLNAMMCRLTLYEIADPESKDYDPELVDKILREAKK